MARRANKTPPNLPFKREEMIAEKILFITARFLRVSIISQISPISQIRLIGRISSAKVQ